jgi:hypothetical protein
VKPKIREMMNDPHPPHADDGPDSPWVAYQPLLGISSPV